VLTVKITVAALHGDATTLDDQERII
jgi:hypothetical protein